MDLKMNTAMKHLISLLTEKGISVELIRDNLIAFKTYSDVSGNLSDDKVKSFVCVTPNKRIGGTYYYYVRTNIENGLLRLSEDKVVELIERVAREEE